MACKQCGSKNEEMFPVELSASFPRIENLGQCPVYLTQRAPICLECGSVELRVPPAELGLLKQALSGARGSSHSAPDSSVGSQ
jgi:hypothetical protein